MTFKRCSAFVKEDGSKKRKRCKRMTETSYCTQHQNMYQNVNQICKGIFVGNKRIAADMKLLQKIGITHIINCASELEHITQNYDQTKFSWLWLPLDDCEYTGDLTKYIETCIKFIDSALTKGRKVLIHCAAGVSRSCSITIAYLMYKHFKTYDEAYMLVKSMRPCCKPNIGFQKQLRQFDFSRLWNDCENMQLEEY